VAADDLRAARTGGEMRTLIRISASPERRPLRQLGHDLAKYADAVTRQAENLRHLRVQAEADRLAAEARETHSKAIRAALGEGYTLGDVAAVAGVTRAQRDR
jgi:hypothetical protein